MLALGPGAIRPPRNTNSPDSQEHRRISASIGPSQKAMQHGRGTGVAILPSSGCGLHTTGFRQAAESTGCSRRDRGRTTASCRTARLRALCGNAARAEVSISCPHVWASKVKARIFVHGKPGRIGTRRTRVLFVSRVQHQFYSIELEQRPIEKNSAASRDTYGAMKGIPGSWGLANVRRAGGAFGDV